MIFKKAFTITDLHFGRSSNSNLANQDNLDFIDWAVEEARTWGADTCIIMGDYFDNRSSVAVSTLNYGLEGLEKLAKHFQVKFIVGNHDLFYRDKRDMTSTVFAKHINNIELITDPITIGNNDKDSITFLPWLVGNEHKTVKNIKSRYVFGHLEMNNFLMNAKVPMPYNKEHLDSDSFKQGPEFVFSGHFHFRQAKDNVVYTGNIMPFNFSDAWDEDRGMMFLEWGKDPTFREWPKQPTYRTMNLSDLINKPKTMLREKLTARVFLDMDITYEEAQVIRDEYAKQYGVRKIELLHVPKQGMNQEFVGEVNFQSVDQIVQEGLDSINSDKIDKNKLIGIYQDLV